MLNYQRVSHLHMAHHFQIKLPEGESGSWHTSVRLYPVTSHDKWQSITGFSRLFWLFCKSRCPWFVTCSNWCLMIIPNSMRRCFHSLIPGLKHPWNRRSRAVAIDELPSLNSSLWNPVLGSFHHFGAVTSHICKRWSRWNTVVLSSLDHSSFHLDFGAICKRSGWSRWFIH